MSTRGGFPFDFGEQAIGLASDSREPRAISLHLEPCYTDHRLREIVVG